MTPSGPEWCSRFPTDRTTAGLEQPFRGRVQRFITALEQGGIAVRITATRRPAERAYLMHWAWRIAREGFDPLEVPPHPDVPIDWVHADRATSVGAAEAMVDTYGLVVRASLTSRHIQGLAVDMDVAWSGTVRVTDANGLSNTLDAAQGNEGNLALHRVGRTYGVHKLVSDPPHWSSDGR